MRGLPHAAVSGLGFPFERGVTLRTFLLGSPSMDASNAHLIKGRAPLRASATLRSTLSLFGRSSGNLSFVYGPKVKRDWVVASDLELFHFLSLEGNPEVESYDLDPQRIVAHLANQGYVGSKPDATVRFRTGLVELVEVKYERDLKTDVRAEFQIAAQKAAATKLGANWSVYTESAVLERERWLQDWADIVVAMSEIKYQSAYQQDDILALLNREKKLDLRSISRQIRGEWLFTFCSVFKLVQEAKLFSNLADEPLSWGTRISQGER